MLTVALQQGINGIVFGSLYVLVALGLTLIYGILVQINFAHADVVTIGAFAAYFFTFAFGGNYLISIGVALMVGAALGWLVNAAIFAPLRVLVLRRAARVAVDGGRVSALVGAGFFCIPQSLSTSSRSGLAPPVPPSTEPSLSLAARASPRTTPSSHFGPPPPSSRSTH